MNNKNLIENVLAYWIANDLLIPNDMPSKAEGIEPLYNKLNKLDNYNELRKFIYSLPKKLSMSCNISFPLDKNYVDFFAFDKAKIEDQKRKIYAKFSANINSDNKNIAEDLYDVSDIDYDICIGEIDTEKLYEYFYKTLNLPDSRVERSHGTCCLFGLRISTDGDYVENSYNLSSFIWGISKCCENNDINWLSQNSAVFENEKADMDKCLRKYTEENQGNILGLLDLALNKTLKIIGNISELVEVNGKIFFGFYRSKDIFEHEKENRIYKSELAQSYFLKDMRMLQGSDLTNSKLADYIDYKNSQIRRINIKEDSAELSKHLHIKSFPLGKWPSKFNLTLMQQAAVNISRNCLNETQPIFSVNGPPGTGKTTLLKEIIADRIVERASLLAEYNAADDAFTKCILSQKYDDFTNCYYKPDKKLISYGVLVASCNNAAVENITKELPIAEGVSSKNAYTELFDIEKCENTLLYRKDKRTFEEKKDIFFTELANRLYGRFKNDDSFCWGLISAPLGKRSNIEDFYKYVLKDFVYRQKLSDDKKQEIFNNAKKQFQDQLKIVNKKRNALIKENNFICHFTERQKTYDKNKIKICNIGAEITNLSQYYADLKTKEMQYSKQLKATEQLMEMYSSKIQKFKNNFGIVKRFWMKRSNTDNFSDYIKDKEKLNLLRNEKRDIRNKINKCKIDRQKAENRQMDLIKQKQKLEEINREFKKIKSELKKEGMYYTDVQNSKILDFTDCDVRNETVPKNNSWQNKDYDREREALFYYALNLQKAFVLTSDAVLNNIRLISKMWGFELNGENKRYPFCKEDRQAAMAHLFNTLFFVTPVISSTFASIQSLFKDVTEENSLGLLIIDEAGQASPHMMLGAYYRAQTAIVVGDPKQIEPVVTTPDPIRRSFSDVDDYKSKILSVQNFADSINPFGTYLKNSGNGENDWVGCPLIVHRRCIDPMFSVSNALSYDDIMINSTKEPGNKTFCIEKSNWLDIKNEKEIGNKNHFVKKQADAILKIISKYYEQNSKLPDVYIITPFTSVKNELIKSFKEDKQDKIKDFDKFLETHVGTVHTFQGKDADEVFFVLGCDSKAISAVKWVNSNIVNVAVTRAKYRLCVVGDKELWTKNNPKNFNGLAEKVDN